MSETKSNDGETILEGIAASPGIAQGDAFVFLQKQLDVPCYDLQVSQLYGEVERFDQAILETRQEITEVRNKIAQSLGEGEARIFDAHLMVLEDSALIDEVISEIRQSKKNVEFCYNNVAERYIAFFNSMEDEYLKERVSDIQDVSRRLLHNLVGQQRVDLSHIACECVVVSEDITPSEAAGLDRGKLLGIATDAGGRTSHSVIMARSLRIPAVVGLHDATSKIRSGDTVLVDGYDGLVVINPSDERLYRYGKLAKERRELEAIYRSALEEPDTTRDGETVELMANIEGAEEMEDVLEMQASGVGLFRTEAIFLRHDGYPPEEAQYEEYAKVAEAAAGRPVIVRTLDIGGDKTLGHGEFEEDNVFMGFRAIRFCLENPDIFRTQLRAILRASAKGQLKIMYPMISGMGEIRRANSFLESVKAELREEGVEFDEGIQVGAMVEVPSAAMIVDLMAAEVDFLSIGTNDLIQYLMAVDRLNDRVAHLYDPAHPAVLRMLHHILKSANAANIPIGVCGEMAGDPLFSAMLVGMGADSLSVTSSLLPEVKYFLRRFHGSEARRLVDDVLALNDPLLVGERLQSFRSEVLGDVFEGGE